MYFIFVANLMHFKNNIFAFISDTICIYEINYIFNKN